MIGTNVKHIACIYLHPLLVRSRYADQNLLPQPESIRDRRHQSWRVPAVLRSTVG